MLKNTQFLLFSKKILIIRMFTDQLTYFVGLKSPRSCIAQSQEKKSTPLDFQYQICNTFLKHTGQRLHSIQAELISQTNDFLSNVGRNCMFPDKNITLETASQSCILNPQQASQSQDEKYGSINRKKMNKITAKRSQENIIQALQDVQKNCSMMNYAILTAIITDYRKLQNRIKNIQSRYRQNLVLKKQQKADRYHEENIILKTKLQTQNKQISFLNKQLHSLKEKNKKILDSVNEKIEQLKENNKYQEINNKVYRDIKAFLGDKQLYVNSRMEKIQCIESNIIHNIQNAVVSSNVDTLQTCSRCCEIMKKIKDSIFNYKQYLEAQAQQIEKLYLKHKKSLFVNKQQALA